MMDSPWWERGRGVPSPRHNQVSCRRPSVRLDRQLQPSRLPRHLPNPSIQKSKANSQPSTSRYAVRSAFTKPITKTTTQPTTKPAAVKTTQPTQVETQDRPIVITSPYRKCSKHDSSAFKTLLENLKHNRWRLQRSPSHVGLRARKSNRQRYRSTERKFRAWSHPAG
ncbi:uncharacterized protein LOC143198438 [Rhynchophorus ferrugineus]|uniref:uncharacterized protein LOC143198438 n=1 Tax=Rhynchophorus ferrugineus TaxID=354439 RepID=UPI003FCD6C41